jgi:hypothetical protein
MATGGDPGPATTHAGVPAWGTATGARHVALFASGLERSDVPTAGMAAAAITATVRRFGIHGCLSRMAQEFSDHPDTAAARMRWICQLTPQMPAWPRGPAGAGRPAEPAMRCKPTVTITVHQREARHEPDM